MSRDGQCCGSISTIGPGSVVGNLSGYRCVSDWSDCRSRGTEFNPGPVPYFCGGWLWNTFYGQSPHFSWIIQEGLLSVTSESMCTKYWLKACSSLPRKNVWLTLKAPITTKVVCFSRLLKCLSCLYGKQGEPRSDCSCRSSLFWVHTVCFYT